ncbi:MAG: acyl-CoA dehydrogenase family protein [Acidimicrobiia bacterium]
MAPRFDHVELSPAELALQREVRAFCDAELPRGSYKVGLGFQAATDRTFSRKLGEKGWLGMALPKEYGGHERGAVDRFIVVEELIRRGAPVHHHWTADRQSSQVILKFGTEAQKQRFLPAICRGELGFSIGMSEPDAGSDLAGIKTRATKTDGGWLINGTKIWTSGAHENEWIIMLVRTSDSADRHDGLSQFLVDLKSPGLVVNPIHFLDGGHHFNEIVLTDVFVPDDMLLGEEGRGWQQNGNELSYERGGPDRLLSAWTLIEEFMRENAGTELGDHATQLLGGAFARFWGIRQMSLSVARMIDDKKAPAVESAMVKEMATRFEQDCIEAVSKLVEMSPSLEAASLLEELLARSILNGPAYTIRGGTIEVLVGVVSKGLH